jgi:hypothetical protein
MTAPDQRSIWLPSRECARVFRSFCTCSEQAADEGTTGFGVAAGIGNSHDGAGLGSLHFATGAWQLRTPIGDRAPAP